MRRQNNSVYEPKLTYYSRLSGRGVVTLQGAKPKAIVVTFGCIHSLSVGYFLARSGPCARAARAPAPPAARRRLEVLRRR